jgi:lipoprotein-anchoring transpeptidase ErfK/SrfK
MVPNVTPFAPLAPVAPVAPVAPTQSITVYVTKSTSSLTIEDVNGHVVFHAPVTSGSEHDPLPIGTWKVNGVQRNPKFHYNPDLFWDASPADRKVTIQPGPNNPVGVVWIDLSKPHYGIHGTPEPSKIGHVESHGCVRLTNWDAARVANSVRPGTRVVFRE